MKLGKLRAEEKEFNEVTYQPALIQEGEGAKAGSKDHENVYENPGNIIRWKYTHEDTGAADPEIPSLELGVHSLNDKKVKEPNSTLDRIKCQIDRVVRWHIPTSSGRTAL